jgi:hypothetical protein
VLRGRGHRVVNPMQRFERRLEQSISGVFARAFRSAVQPVEIAAALLREADNSAQVMSRDRSLVPNDFFVELSQADLERLAPYDNALEAEMIEQLRDHAEEQHYVFPGPLSVKFEAAADLTTGRFRVRSHAKASVTTQANMRQQRRGVAYLVINGERHALVPPSMTVGRGENADLRINDPGVSRKHIELEVGIGRAEDGSIPVVSVRDLGSTNGLLVDGHRITSAYLRHGSLIAIGNTEMTLYIEHEDVNV